MPQLRVSRTEPKLHRHVEERAGVRVRPAPTAMNRGQDHTPALLSLTTSESAESVLRPRPGDLHFNHADLDVEREDDESKDGRIQFYGDNASIFDGSSFLDHVHRSPVFATQKRLLPWEARPLLADVHAYSSQPSSMKRASERREQDIWRLVAHQHRRKRPPRAPQRAAMPGSTLARRRDHDTSTGVEAQRARVGTQLGVKQQKVRILKGTTEPASTCLPLPPLLRPSLSSTGPFTESSMATRARTQVLPPL